MQYPLNPILQDIQPEYPKFFRYLDYNAIEFDQFCSPQEIIHYSRLMIKFQHFHLHRNRQQRYLDRETHILWSYNRN